MLVGSRLKSFFCMKWLIVLSGGANYSLYFTFLLLLKFVSERLLGSSPVFVLFLFFCYRRIAPIVQNRFVPAKVNPKSHDEVDEIKNRGGMRKTLDSRFASMKEQRKTIRKNYGVKSESSKVATMV